MKSTVFYLFWVALFGLSHTLAQNKREFETLSSKDGLSHNKVFCALKDRHGFMWFGTQDGLCVFDGYSFKTYNHKPYDSTSLSDNFILSLFEDSQKNLWIGTYSGGLLRFNRDNESFEKYVFHKDQPGSLSNNSVRVIMEDSKKRLWVGTKAGLNLMDRQSGTFKRFMVADGLIAHDYVLNILEDAAGSIWAGTRGGGLARIKPDLSSSKIYRKGDASALPDDVLWSSFRDSKKRLWFGTFKGGLCLYDPLKDAFSNWRHSATDSNSLANDWVAAIQEDAEGNIWAGTDNGISLFAPKTDGSYAFEENIKAAGSGLANDVVMFLLKDDREIFWIGTFGGGISKYAPMRKKFASYKNIRAQNEYYSNNIAALLQTPDGHLWAGANNGGLYRYAIQPDSEKGGLKSLEIKSYFSEQSKSAFRLGNNDVTCLAAAEGGKIWAGTYSTGLYLLHPEKGIEKHWGTAEGLVSENISSLAMQGGALWIGTGTGLNRLDTQTGKLETFVNAASDKNSLANNRVGCLYADKSGNVWIGTWGGGVSVNRPGTKGFLNLSQNGQAGDLSSNRVFSVFQDAKANIWIGTDGGGLNLLKTKTGEKTVFEHFTIENGLPSNVVNAIAEAEGKIWFSTNAGLALLDPEKKTVQRYDLSDGLQENNFNPGAACALQDGQIVFGGINGFNVFHPQKIRRNLNLPPIKITAFKKYYKKTKLPQDLLETRSIELNYDDHVFSFDFAALDYNMPSKNRYAYKMEGFDKDWVYPDAGRTAVYTNLDPKKYTFRVKGANNDGLWNEEGASIEINIKPPFWKTYWFRIFSVILVAGSAYSFYRYRMASVKKTNERLEKLVEKRTSEVVEQNRLLEGQNYEILMQKEELEQQQEEIMAQRDHIIDKNVELQLSQKEIMKKNEHITDSIRYAQTIQAAILPSLQKIKACFPESFVLFRPKDIVSGDFYWFADLQNDAGAKSCFLAVVDCTGHGVPGAFMSMIANTLLNDIVKQKKIWAPQLILAELDREIRIALRQDEGANTDGMDLALCRFDVKKDGGLNGVFCGAKRPLYILKKGTEATELLQFAGCRRSIGGFVKDGTADFEPENFVLEKGDRVYLFSDGLPDQNGPGLKKFGSPLFRTLLLQHFPLPMEAQKEALASDFDAFVQGEHQRDDITVIGIEA